MATAATWIAGALVLGWLATLVSVAVPGGHPPMWYGVGACVVLASFVLAPIGAGAALATMRRARRAGTTAPRFTVAALASNLLLLAVAVGVWCLFYWLATRR